MTPFQRSNNKQRLKGFCKKGLKSYKACIKLKTHFKEFIPKIFLKKLLSQKIHFRKRNFLAPSLKISHISGGISKAPKTKIYYTSQKKSYE